MPRVSSGSFGVRVLGDGTRAFRLRFNVDGERRIVILHERAGCECGCGGGWEEPAARTELGNILARVRAGVWKPPESQIQSAPATKPGAMTFHEYASSWLQAKIDGVIGEKPIDENTAADYRWRLTCHLLPYFATYKLRDIDRDLCRAFKAHKLHEAKELREAIDAGADIRDRRGRKRVPLGPSSICKLIDGLATILDDAIEDGHIDSNHARSKRMRVSVPKPNRSFLEMDELACVLDAAATQDRPLPADEGTQKFGPTTALVAHLLDQGKRPSQIAKQLGIAKSTVSFHVRKIGASVGRGYAGRRVICEILGRSGVRVTELCDMQ